MRLSIPLSTSYKILFFKSVIFMIPWAITLWTVNYFWPHLIISEKIVTNMFSNSLVFLLGYILTMIGFRYSSKDENRRKDETEDRTDSVSYSGCSRVVPGTNLEQPQSRRERDLHTDV